MDLSRKVILASCIGFSFLAYGIGCSVEDRDIERAGTFVCRTDADCLKGSECVKNKKTDEEGRCARSDEVKHCLDNDGDGYIGVSVEKDDPRYSGYITECGFGAKNPQDVDDNDASIYPDAPEVCDGKDNDGDGCIDGTCSHESRICDADLQNYCVIITEPCWGSGNVSDYDNSVCSAALIGYRECRNGKLQYIAPTDTSSQYKGTACPTDASAAVADGGIPGYKDTEDGDLMCDGKDNNCNGAIDEACVICSDELGQMGNDLKCVVTKGGKIEKGQSNYNMVKAACEGTNADKKDAKCACLGEYKCPSSDKGMPACTNADGVNLETTPLDEASNHCLRAFD